MVITLDADLGVAGRPVGLVRTDDTDDLHYRVERTEGSGTLTGVLEYSLVLSDTDEGQWSDLIMTDTQISSIVVDKAAFVRFRVKTAQAGYKAQIHIYTRTRPIASV